MSLTQTLIKLASKRLRIKQAVDSYNAPSKPQGPSMFRDTRGWFRQGINDEAHKLISQITDYVNNEIRRVAPNSKLTTTQVVDKHHPWLIKKPNDTSWNNVNYGNCVIDKPNLSNAWNPHILANNIVHESAHEATRNSRKLLGARNRSAGAGKYGYSDNSWVRNMEFPSDSQTFSVRNYMEIPNFSSGYAPKFKGTPYKFRWGDSLNSLTPYYFRSTPFGTRKERPRVENNGSHYPEAENGWFEESTGKRYAYNGATETIPNPYHPEIPGSTKTSTTTYPLFPEKQQDVPDFLYETTAPILYNRGMRGINMASNRAESDLRDPKRNKAMMGNRVKLRKRMAPLAQAQYGQTVSPYSINPYYADIINKSIITPEQNPLKYNYDIMPLDQYEFINKQMDDADKRWRFDNSSYNTDSGILS